MGWDLVHQNVLQLSDSFAISGSRYTNNKQQREPPALLLHVGTLCWETVPVFIFIRESEFYKTMRLQGGGGGGKKKKEKFLKKNTGK